MYKSPSHLPEPARAKIADALNARLADGLDLHSQIKVAHWNIKGPQFAALHPLFETFAVSLAAHNDAIAERAVTLGARAYGTARHVAKIVDAARIPARRRPRHGARGAAGRPDRAIPGGDARRRAQASTSWTTPTRSTC